MVTAVGAEVGSSRQLRGQGTKGLNVDNTGSLVAVVISFDHGTGIMLERRPSHLGLPDRGGRTGVPMGKTSVPREAATKGGWTGATLDGFLQDRWVRWGE